MAGYNTRSVFRMGVVLFLVNQIFISVGVAAASPSTSVPNALDRLVAIVDSRASSNEDSRYSLLRLKMEARAPLKYLHSVAKYVSDSGEYGRSLALLNAAFRPATDYMYRIKDYESFRADVKTRVDALRSSLTNVTWRREDPGCLRAIMGPSSGEHHRHSHRGSFLFGQPDRSSPTYYSCDYHRRHGFYNPHCMSCARRRREREAADNELLYRAGEGVSDAARSAAESVRNELQRTEHGAQNAAHTVKHKIESGSHYVANRAERPTHMLGNQVQGALHSVEGKTEPVVRQVENTSSWAFGQTKRGANNVGKKVDQGFSSFSHTVSHSGSKAGHGLNKGVHKAANKVGKGFSHIGRKGGKR